MQCRLADRLKCSLSKRSRSCRLCVGDGRSGSHRHVVWQSDITTPEFICDAAASALRRGQTFYTQKWGIPRLRETLAVYTGGSTAQRLRGIEDGYVVWQDGIMMMMQALVGAGDNILVVDPIWPNGASAAQVMGGEVRRIASANSQGVGISISTSCSRRTLGRVSLP